MFQLLLGPWWNVLNLYVTHSYDTVEQQLNNTKRTFEFDIGLCLWSIMNCALWKVLLYLELLNSIETATLLESVWAIYIFEMKFLKNIQHLFYTSLIQISPCKFSLKFVYISSILYKLNTYFKLCIDIYFMSLPRNNFSLCQSQKVSERNTDIKWSRTV